MEEIDVFQMKFEMRKIDTISEEIWLPESSQSRQEQTRNQLKTHELVYNFNSSFGFL